MRNTIYSSIALRAFAEVERTGALASGWNYGRGVPADFTARQNANLVIALLISIGIDDLGVFPDTDGGVMITGYRAQESYEILAEVDGGYDLVFEDDRGLRPAERADNFDALTDILGGRGWRRNTSASFLQNIMTLGSNATSVSPSRIQPGAVFPLLRSIALSQQPAVYVSTSSSTTLGSSWAPPLHSGGLMRQKSPADVPSLQHLPPAETIVIAT